MSVLIVAQLYFLRFISWASDSVPSVPAADLLTLEATNVSTLGSPSSAPDNVTLLAPKITKSVVTILSRNKQGTARAINTKLTVQQKNQGFKSYLITNHHEIADCIQNTILILKAMDTDKYEINPLDEKIRIDWVMELVSFIISEKDTSAPELAGRLKERKLPT